MNKPVKAYHDTNFMKSADARTIRLLAEYLEPQSRFAHYNIKDTVVFFGSSRILSPEQARSDIENIRQRTKARGSDSKSLPGVLKQAEMRLAMSRYYTEAVRLAYLITTWSKQIAMQRKRGGRRFIICSGGGPGIMEAANRGASEAEGYSIGLNISLPLEQQPNPYISKELTFEFHYFFIRQLWFGSLAKALVVFPGGFGTMDELVELLTLIQTRKIRRKVPVIIYGTDFWKRVINFDALVEWGMISPEDLDLFHFSDTPEDAFDFLRKELESLL